MRCRPERSIQSEEITPRDLFLNRRQFIRATAAAGIAATTGVGTPARAGVPLAAQRNARYSVREGPSNKRLATSYNNFYEFGADKRSPAFRARGLKTRPWEIEITGAVEAPQTLGVEELLERYPLEERVYRLRCVEAWSMVVPWIGFPLASLLQDMGPTSEARYVEFTTLFDSDQMPRQKGESAIEWPYVEALRLDEALHPLTMLVVGYYGQALENQSGAPIRLIVPWKYGFKSIKSIVKIRVTAELPRTSWNDAAPHEYGFYANVNPEVDHPRWSQATERRLGKSGRIPTLPFNGYAADVAGLYKGMNLKKLY